MNKQKRKPKDIGSCSLPNSQPTERAVLGMLIIESTAINEVIAILEPEMFYDYSLGVVYGAIRTIADRGDKVDMISVTRELIRIDRIDEVGGPFFVSKLASDVASSVSIVEHSMYIHQLYLARQLALVCQMMASKALDQTNDIEDVIAEAMKEVENVASGTCYNVNHTSISNASIRAVERYQERENRVRRGEKIGIPTGLEKLDKCTGGWKPQEVIIVAARPGMGKTAFMLHMAKTAASSGVPVVIFTLEMSTDSLSDRFMLSEMSILPDRYKNGYMSDEEKPIMCNAADRLAALPIIIDETAGITVQQIKARAKNLQRKGQCGMIMIDYMQLIEVAGNESYTRENEVSQCSKAIKRMAKDLNVPVVVLSQLSRKIEERQDKTPVLADLRESGSIEQDADVVLFISRPEYYDNTKERGKGFMRLAKQRNGVTGDFPFQYNENLTRFGDEGDTLEMPF